MTIYIIIFLFSLLCIAKKRDNWLVYVLWLLMLCVTIFRDEYVGADTWTYMNNFAWREEEGSRSLELLNNFMYLTLYTNNWDNRIVLCVYGVLSYVFLFFISKKYKIRLSYVLLFFFLSGCFIKGLNISRQMLSALIVCYSIPYIFESTKKRYLFFAFVAIATQFHFTSFIFTLLYLFRFINIKNKLLLVAVPGVIGLFFILNIINIDNLIRAFMPEVYNDFLGSIKIKNEVTFFGIIARLVVMAIQLYMLKSTESKYNVMFAFSVALLCSAMGMDFVIARMFLVLDILIFLYIASIFSGEVESKSQKSILLLYLLLAVYFCFNSIISNNTINNYQFMKF